MPSWRWIWSNIPGYNWKNKVLNMSELKICLMHIAQGHYTNFWAAIETETYSEHYKTFKMDRFAKAMPECKCAITIFSGQRAPTTIEFNTFCWNFAHVFYLVMSTKGCVGFFYLFRSRVIDKIVKKECVETRSLLIFANNSRSK